MDWNDLRHFLALARTGSVRAAGASLGVSHSTVSRRIEALEAQLGARLFDRGPDGFELAEAGRQVLPGAERVEAEMAALERGVLGQDERLEGTVALTCSDGYVSSLLLPDLTAFCAENPGIELQLTIDPRPYDLSRREADVAIRALALGKQPAGYLIGTLVAPVVLCSYVAHAHAARLDPDLGGPEARWASFDDRAIQERMVAGSSYPDLPLWGSFGSIELMAQAAREGLGLAMLPTYAGDRVPELRRLARPDLRHLADFWVLSHPDLRDNARIRATRARVAKGLKGHTALFSGERPAGAPARPEIAPEQDGGSVVR